MPLTDTVVLISVECILTLFSFILQSVYMCIRYDQFDCIQAL